MQTNFRKLQDVVDIAVRVRSPGLGVGKAAFYVYGSGFMALLVNDNTLASVHYLVDAATKGLEVFDFYLDREDALIRLLVAALFVEGCDPAHLRLTGVPHAGAPDLAALLQKAKDSYSDKPADVLQFLRRPL